MFVSKNLIHFNEASFCGSQFIKKIILYLIVATVAPKWPPDANEDRELKSGSLGSKARTRTQVSRLLPSALRTSLGWKEVTRR